MVSHTWRNFLTPCWRPCSGEYEMGEGDAGHQGDGLSWYKDLGHHVHGEFSMAVIQANRVLEDQSQLESGPMSVANSGPHGTFVGIYDGHAGPEASRFINYHLFENIKIIRDAEFTSDNREMMSADVIRRAFLSTEEEFLSLVRRQWEIIPRIASVGSCCLVGIICCGLLYIANAGDSRAVLGRRESATNKHILAVQLSDEHNASFKSIREELQLMHPNDPHVVVLRHQVWRVKGIIQVSRSIGDAYLKKSEFNKPPLLPKFILPEPFQKPILLSEPSVLVQKLHPEDLFIIFASDGLWEHLSNQEAVELVHNSSSHKGIARKLVKAALKEAAKKREMRYTDLAKIDCGVRRHFHDDITVIVLFLDSHLISQSSSCIHGPILSVKGDVVSPGGAHAD